MTSPNENPPGEERQRQPYVGGADAVPDSPAVTGAGAEPGAERRAGSRGVPAGGGMPALAWVGIALAVLALAFYGFTVFFR